MGTKEIKITYSDLDNIIKQLLKYKKALRKIIYVIKSNEEILSMQKGLSIEALKIRRAQVEKT